MIGKSRAKGAGLDEVKPFGALLKQLRQRAGLTQELLGGAVGYGVAQISMLENGKRLPDPKIVAERFVIALHLEKEPQVATRLVQLAHTAQLSTPGHGQSALTTRLPRLSSLPNPLTPIEGRSRERVDLQQLLASGTSRLVTLVGPPGVGKTRLAIAVGQSVIDQFADGVWWIDLSSVTDPKHLIIAIAQGMRLTLPGTEPSLEQLKRSLQLKSSLIVLDNFEQIIEAAGTVAELLVACGAIQILVTSRLALNIYGEVRYKLDGLRRPSMEDADDLRSVRQAAATALFINRAHAIMPEFRLTTANAKDVVLICQLLDGLPLAIELAVAQLIHLPIKVIAARLNSGGAIDQQWVPMQALGLPDRHQTVFRAIESSYRLLGQNEQQLFCQLGVLGGQWRLESAQAICDSLLITELPVLIAHHMLVTAHGADGSIHYYLLETLRQFARAYLELSDEAKQIHQRHAVHFCKLAINAHQKADFSVWGPTNQHMLLHQANLREALEWCTHNDVVIGLTLAAHLWKFWEAWGQLGEGSQWLEKLLALNDVTHPWHVLAMTGLAWLQRNLGRNDVAEILFQSALAVSKRQNLPQLHQELLVRSADNLRAIRKYDEAQELLQQALELSKGTGESEVKAAALWAMATLQANQGQYEIAADTNQRYIDLAGQLNNRRHLGWGQAYAAEIARLNGNVSEMRRLVTEAKNHFAETEDKQGQVFVALVPISVDVKAGKLQQARLQLKFALRIAHEYGLPVSRTGRVLCYLGITAIQDGRAFVGVRLLSAAEKVDPNWANKAIPYDITWREETLKAARQILRDSEFDQAWLDGQTISLDDTVAFALSDSV